MWINPLTLSLHELVDVALPGSWFGLGQVHTVEVVVAHQVIFGIASHIDSLQTRTAGTHKKGFMIQRAGHLISLLNSSVLLTFCPIYMHCYRNFSPHQLAPAANQTQNINIHCCMYLILSLTLHLFSQNPGGTNWKGRCVLISLGGSIFSRRSRPETWISGNGHRTCERVQTHFAVVDLTSAHQCFKLCCCSFSCSVIEHSLKTKKKKILIGLVKGACWEITRSFIV